MVENASNPKPSHAQKMPPAMRRYLKRLFISMVFYAIALIFAVSMFNSGNISGVMGYVTGVLPALPVIAIFWTIGKLLSEMDDEYQRLLMVRQVLVATGLTLTAATLWGFLEQFELVMHIPAYYWAVLWFGGLGVGSLFNRLTIGSDT